VLPGRNNPGGYLAGLVTAVLGVLGGLIALRRPGQPPPPERSTDTETVEPGRRWPRRSTASARRTGPGTSCRTSSWPGWRAAPTLSPRCCGLWERAAAGRAGGSG